MPYRILTQLLILVLPLLLGACSALLPHGEKKVISQWVDFEEAKAAYDKIIPYRTSRSELKVLGFSPDHPNVRILNRSEVFDRLFTGPGRQSLQLPKGLRDCMTAGGRCSGYEVQVRVTYNRRYGNFLADMLNFKRKVETRGWEFHAILVMIDDKVVYKTWSGTPAIREYSDTTNPLGPLQGIGPSLIPSP
jgi:hypothetical protein